MLSLEKLKKLEPDDGVFVSSNKKYNRTIEKGGPGSGNYGHEGRQREVGGSAPGSEESEDRAE